MSGLVLHREQSQAIALPAPRVAVGIREATLADVKFIDDLQKKHAKMVGWFPTKQIEACIKAGQVLIAEEVIHHGGHGEHGERQVGVGLCSAHGRSPSAPSVNSVVSRPVGYCIARDTYMKREDCGIVYQLNVAPTMQRGLIGATLIKAVFERAAYGCRLFCCWCAQDIEANRFWESIGFVPLAFRTGSRAAGAKREPRIHIFWQRRIREGDDQTPYWFPSQTTGGAVRENRLVLPIPPGTHWSDAKPAVLPGLPKLEEGQALALEGATQKPSRARSVKKIGRAPSRNSIAMGGLRFAPAPAEKKAEKVKPVKQRFRNDPKYVAAARELRDRYMEQINEGLLLPPSACGKYDVSRQLESAARAVKVEAKGLLEAA